MSTSAAILAASPVTASIAVTSLETMLSAVKLSPLTLALSAWLFLPHAPRASAALAVRIRRCILKALPAIPQKRGCRQYRQPLEKPTPPMRGASGLHRVVRRRRRRRGVRRLRRVHVGGVTRRVHVRRRRVHVSRRSIHVRRRKILVDVHGVVGGIVAAASRNRQGRTSDQDKSTHSRLPIYCDLQRFPVPQIGADNSLKQDAPSRLFASASQGVEK